MLGKGSVVVTLRCFMWVPVPENRKLQRSCKQKVAKVSKRNVLRRSKIFIAVP